MKTIYILLLSTLSLSAFGRNYYVSAKNGSSENGGTRSSDPKKTIQQAADLTKPGDTVFVMNGIYTNDCKTCSAVEIPHSGQQNKYIVYTNYPGHRPILKFDGWSGFSIIGKSYIRIHGFEVIGNNANVKLKDALVQPQSCRNKKGTLDPRYNGVGIAISAKSHHIIVSGNSIHDCGGGGIGALHSDYITVQDNIVYNNSWYSVFGHSGISFYQFWNSGKGSGKGYQNIIRRNKTFNNKTLVPWRNTCQLADGNGIIIDDFRNRQNGSRYGRYNGRTLIENNISWYNGGTGIHTFQSDHVDIVNNTAYLNSLTKGLNAGQILSGFGYNNKIINNILVSNGSIRINSNFYNTNLTYLNNLHYNISFPGRELISISGSNSIRGKDPGFINPSFSLNANFGLKSNSPAIDCGRQSFYSKSDFHGTSRPKDGAPDIGAIEFDSGRK